MHTVYQIIRKPCDLIVVKTLFKLEALEIKKRLEFQNANYNYVLDSYKTNKSLYDLEYEFKKVKNRYIITDILMHKIKKYKR